MLILRPNRLYDLSVDRNLLLNVLSWHAIHTHAIHPHCRVRSRILYHLLLYLLAHHNIFSLQNSSLFPQLLHLKLLPIKVLPYINVLTI